MMLLRRLSARAPRAATLRRALEPSHSVRAINKACLGRVMNCSSSSTVGGTPSSSDAPKAEDAPLYTVHDVVSWIQEERGVDISALDVHTTMSGALGHYFVFTTANTKSHMRKIAKNVVYSLKQRGVFVFGSHPTVQGMDAEDWALVDGGDVVVSIFVKHARQQYDLEKHWESLGGRPVDLQIDQVSDEGTTMVDPLAAWSEEHAYAAPKDADSSSVDQVYAETDDEVYREEDQVYAETDDEVYREEDQVYAETDDEVYREEDQVYAETDDEVNREEDQVYAETDEVYREDSACAADEAASQQTADQGAIKRRKLDDDEDDEDELRELRDRKDLGDP
ncbi:hypothetical protein AB1Y20_010569 [Prymnesium parvum]|uniref:Ribosomal silencing factor RsfS n=1 Tax=Prymnesium parvum TaxID=97485 RepID=A0AB34IT55_PRYPA